MATGDYAKKQAKEAEARHKRLQKIGDVVPHLGAPVGHKKHEVAKRMGARVRLANGRVLTGKKAQKEADKYPY